MQQNTKIEDNLYSNIELQYLNYLNRSKDWNQILLSFG
jgi:hypothetical protein